MYEKNTSFIVGAFLLISCNGMHEVDTPEVAVSSAADAERALVDEIAESALQTANVIRSSELRSARPLMVSRVDPLQTT